MTLEALRGGKHLAAVFAVAIRMRVVVVTVEGLGVIEGRLAKLAFELIICLLFQVFSLVVNEEPSRTFAANLAPGARHLKRDVRFKLVQFVALKLMLSQVGPLHEDGST